MEALVNNLRDEGKEDLKKAFPHTYSNFKKKWPTIDEEASDMLTRKLLYPYEYMDIVHGWTIGVE